MTKVRVVVAMSGGVDSCVAAALLKDGGYDVVGVTMQLWNHGADSDGGDTRFDSCCSLADVHDARLAAHTLGIPHYVVNYEKEFRSGVVDYFAAEYAAGRTPNPCVMCNSKLKFDHLVDRARALGADWVATGHYARVVHYDNDRPSELLAGVDPTKDQSYFLFGLKTDYLRRAMFPLGGLTKAEVRQIAGGLGLHTAEKHESQEICFVTGGRYTEFLEKNYPDVTTGRGGDIVDRAGRILGVHDGIHKFTVGQRKGLGHLGTVPYYVALIDAGTNRIVVDSLDNLSVESFQIGSVNWLVDVSSITSDRVLNVMVRFRAKKVRCRVVLQDDGYWQVLLAEKARWVAPGQAAVFYDEDRVIGGGFIANPSTSDGPRAPAELARFGSGQVPSNASAGGVL